MLSSANTMVCSVSLILSQSKSLPSSFTCFERFSEASVHTAVESDRFGIEISVQRLELLITLYCGHGFLRLCSSLKINHEIGRASCRERVSTSGVAGAFKNK